MIPGFLAHRLAGPIAAALLLLSLAGNAFLGVNLWASERANGKLMTRNGELAADLARSRVNGARLREALAGANASIDSLKAAADLAAANAARAQAEAEREAATLRSQRAAIRSAKPGADRCASASQLIRDTLARERQQ